MSCNLRKAVTLGRSMDSFTKNTAQEPFEEGFGVSAPFRLTKIISWFSGLGNWALLKGNELKFLSS